MKLITTKPECTLPYALAIESETFETHCNDTAFRGGAGQPRCSHQRRPRVRGTTEQHFTSWASAQYQTITNSLNRDPYVRAHQERIDSRARNKFNRLFKGALIKRGPLIF